MNFTSKIVFKHFFRPENKVIRSLPVYHPLVMSKTDTLPEAVIETGKEDFLDLNGYLISHPSSTFLVKVSGEPLGQLGINPGDILVIDQTIEVRDSNLIVGSKGNSFMVSYVKMKNKQLYLTSETPGGPDRLITPELKLDIWGVVSYVIHKPELKSTVTERVKQKSVEMSSELTRIEEALAFSASS
jgi:DNA polymerase V